SGDIGPRADAHLIDELVRNGLEVGPGNHSAVVVEVEGDPQDGLPLRGLVMDGAASHVIHHRTTSPPNSSMTSSAEPRAVSTMGSATGYRRPSMRRTRRAL